MNDKRVYRLYGETDLPVRRRKKVKGPASARVPLQLAQGVNEVSRINYDSEDLSNGQRMKFLTVADNFSHACVDVTADCVISGEYVTRLAYPCGHLLRLPAGRAH